MYVKCINTKSEKIYLFNIVSKTFYDFDSNRKVDTLEKEILNNIYVYLSDIFVTNPKIVNLFKGSNLYAILIKTPEKHINYTNSPLNLVGYKYESNKINNSSLSFTKFISNNDIIDSLLFRLVSEDSRVDTMQPISNIIFKSLI